MNILIQIVLLMVMLELIEANLQKAGTLELMIERLYGYYQKSIFLFFLVHPSYYFVIFISLYLNLLDFYIIAILVIKSLDIFFKIEMIQQRFIKQEMDEELKIMMKMKMAPWMSLLGVIMYVPLLAMSIFS
ncbi:MAG: hypothetical protein K0U38_03620 [Epsilonproteobacteria bacterium]|nr:hypothetical protein [Campylobacterota bacterium]